MTKTILLGATLAAVFAVSMIMLPAFAVGHLTLDPANTAAIVVGNSLKVKITTTGTIPVDGTSAFGYAVLTSGSGSPNSNNVLVLVTHLPAFDDSSFENPVSGFHTHVLDLKGPTGACGGATFEVDFATSPSNTGIDKNYPYNIIGDTAIIKHATVRDLNGSTVDAIAAFTASVPGFNPDGSPTNVCVTVTDLI